MNQMGSPVQARNTSFHWGLQPDPWDSRFEGPSRVSPYTLKYPSIRNSEYEPLKPSSSSYSNWGRESITAPGGFSWQQQSGVSYQYPSSGSHFKDPGTSYRSSADQVYAKDHIGHDQLSRPQISSEQHLAPNQPGTSLDGSHANRNPKRHVKSACNNCKKAHLACDNPRPCTRCVQNNKIAGCYDVPQRRKGRPRLRQDNIGKTGRSTIHKPISAKPPLLMAQDPRSTGSLQYFDFHPEMSFATELCNDYTTVPVAFLDMDLKVVQMNQHFRGLFGFNGDMYSRRLDELVETADYHLLSNLRWWLRQEVDLVMSNSSIPVQALEYPDATRIPSFEAQDTVGVVKTAFRRENIRFRFADGISRMLTVEFSVARAAILFVSLTFPSSRASAATLQSHYQHKRGVVHPLTSPFIQAHEPLRNFYGRQPDRLAPVQSPDTSSYFSISPSSSSFSFSSTTSSLPTNGSRHTSITSQRSYDNPLASTVNASIQPPQLATISLSVSPKQPIHSSYSTSHLNTNKASSPQLAPLQDRNVSLLNSRRLPPLPGLGSPSSASNETTGPDNRGQQNSWPSPESAPASPEDKGKDTWRCENLTSKRTRLDVKDLAS